MVRVRRFESGDTPAIKRLHRLALRDVGTDPDDVPGTEDLDDIRGSFLDSGGEFLVAVAEGGIVGMGGLKVDGETAELFRMRVHPDHQREGIGATLLEHLESAARERGATRIEAETADRQSAAVAFYPSHGFTEVGHRTVGEYRIHRYEKAL